MAAGTTGDRTVGGGGPAAVLGSRPSPRAPGGAKSYNPLRRRGVVPGGHDANDSSSERQGKVGRLVDEYGLEGVGAEMERLWTDDGDDRMSLRDLADRFNRQLLATAMADAGMRPLAGEVENVHRLLTGEDVGGADRTRARRRLEREGVDVEELLGDFVSYGAVRTYLREHRNAEYPGDDRDRIAVESENIRRLRGRVTRVAETKLDRLRTGEAIALGDFRSHVQISVLCEDCGTQYEVDELLARGGCDCEAPREP